MHNCSFKLCSNTAAVSVLLAICTPFTSELCGEIIRSRADLVSALGAAAITEDFESYLFPTNTAQRVGTELDASSVIHGQGPGLVRPGVRFVQDPPGEGLQWDRQFEYGLQSAALVSDNQLIIDFTNPVTHAGFDMFWFHVAFPLADPGTIQVFGADDVSMLYSTNIFEPFAPDSYFFSFTSQGGIGRIVLFRDEGEGLGVSPMIDNLTFGLVARLSIGMSGDQVRISWPAIATAYELEATTNPVVQAAWKTITNVPVPLNGQNTVMLPATDSCKFFRLRGN